MATLSFEQAPPISVPLRFFLSAPIFGMLAGALLLWLGPEVLVSRWTPATLAATHLMTAGFMLQAMCGALLQFVPVATGGNIRRPLLVAGFVHPALCAAVICFTAAFLTQRYAWLDLAAMLFASGLGAYVYAVGSAIFRVSGGSTTITALRLALGSLLVTVVSGILLVQMLQGRIPVPAVSATNVHLAWGLLGWAGLLLIGVAYFVVPMFQMTPHYPQPVQKYLAPSLLAALILWSLQLAADLPAHFLTLVATTLLAGPTFFALTTLWLQSKRKRKINDPALQFFRGAMICVLATVLAWLLLQLLPGDGEFPALPQVLGALILHGIFGSAICGMMYKILPFAMWMNLQQLDPSLATKVNTRKLLAETPTRHHLYLHFLALIVLLPAPVVPVLARPAGLLLVAAYGWLGWNLYGVVRCYLRYRPLSADGFS